MILRFGDSDTQIVILVYPGGQSEIIHYSVAGGNKGELPKLISKMEAENPDVTDKEIAAEVKIVSRRSPVNFKELNRTCDELKSIRIPPLFESRVALDDCSEYEFWYDTWQESVHYVFACAFGKSPQDELVRWMIKFRENLPALIRASSGAKS